jgi:acetyl esterase/lipase
MLKPNTCLHLTREQLDDMEVSPISRSFAKFPPVYVSVGQCEVLLDQVGAQCVCVFVCVLCVCVFVCE